MSARTVTYAYYTETYHGTAVEETDWARVSQLASAHLERVKTLAKVTPYGDEAECESMAICAMSETMLAWEEASATGAGGTRSESIGSVSVSYASAAELFPKGLGPALIDAMRPWLHVYTVVG